MHRLRPRKCKSDVGFVDAKNTYATKKVILEVELEVGVLLDGAEDLLKIVSIAVKATT